MRHHHAFASLSILILGSSAYADTGEPEGSDTGAEDAPLSPTPQSARPTAQLLRFGGRIDPASDESHSLPVWAVEESFSDGPVTTTWYSRSPAGVIRWATSPHADTPASEGLAFESSDGTVLHLRASHLERTLVGSTIASGRGEGREDVVWAVSEDAEGRLMGIISESGREWFFADVGNDVVQVVERETPLRDAWRSFGREEHACGMDAVGSRTGSRGGVESLVVDANGEEVAEESAGAGAVMLTSICGVDSYIDVMIVTTPGALAEARAVENNPSVTSTDLAERVRLMIALGNVALRDSGVDAVLRVVHIEHIPLGGNDPTTGGDLLPMLQGTSAAMFPCLRDPDHATCTGFTGFAWAAALREDHGADILVVLTDNLFDHNGSAPGNGDTGFGLGSSPTQLTSQRGCDLPRFWDPNGWTFTPAVNNDSPLTMSVWSNGWNTVVHEIGHVLGADHGAWQGTTSFSSTARAFAAPDCTYNTIMGGGTPTGCSGNPPDITFFSGLCAEGSLTTEAIDLGNSTANNVGTMNTMAPIIRDMRAEVVPDQSALRSSLTSPANGVNLGTSATFTWNDTTPGVADLYILELSTTFNGNDLHSAVYLNTYSANVTGLPATNAPEIYGRLWTLLPGVAPNNTPVWDFRDYRFDVANTIVGCNTIDPRSLSGIVADSHAGAACASVCSVSGSTMTCDINDGSYASNPGNKPWLMSATRRHGNTSFDYGVWGVNEQGTAFCCLYRDATPTVSAIDFKGSQRSDVIHLRQCGGHSLSPAGTSLDVSVTGFAGGDEILGSDSVTAIYDETLMGSANNDYIDGGDGADIIFGGSGNDTLLGGPGGDDMQGNAGVDYVSGGSGSDIVCDRNEADTLLGGSEVDWIFSTNTTLVTANGGPDGAVCATPALSGDPGCTSFLADTSGFWSICNAW